MKPVLWCLSFLRAGPVGLVFVYSYAAHVPRLLRVPAVLSTACSFCRYCVYVRGGNGPKAKADCLPPPHFPHSLSLFSISLRIHNKFYSSGSVVLLCYHYHSLEAAGSDTRWVLWTFHSPPKLFPTPSLQLGGGPITPIAFVVNIIWCRTVGRII